MLQRIMTHWDHLIHLGVDKAPSEQIGRKIELSNQISMSLFLIGIPILLFFILFVPFLTYILATVSVLMICLLIPFWNGKGYYNFTRILICTASTLSSVLFPLIGKLYLFNEHIGVAMYFIPRFYLLSAMIAPLLLIDLSEKKKLVGCILFNAVFLIGFDYIDSLFGVGFYQKGYESPQYYFSNFYILTNYLFLLSALLYLQFDNKKYEEQIINLNRTLDGRVKEKTRELENANTDLEAFNFMVSHELKTPLTASRMISQSMKSLYKEKLGEKGTEDLNTLNNCLVEMQKLIESIMNFSKIGRLSENIEMLDMNEIVDEVMSDFELIGIPENIKVVIKDLPASKADRAMIKQVFSNLISNALKYSRKKEHAVVEINGKKGDGENIYFVKDNGIGFSMSDRDKLFGLFERLHSKADYEGSGLGLPIVERIVKRHGGRVWAEGEPGRGATIYFSLPT